MAVREKAICWAAAILAVVSFGTELRAGTGADNAGNFDYVFDSWLDGQNAGSGFGPWTLVSEATNGGFAGFFAADDLAGTRGLDNVGVEQDIPLPYSNPPSEGYFWASFANKGDGIDAATAFRSLSEPLDGAGDTFSASYEHGFVNGQTGIALRSGNAIAAAADFAAGARSQFYFLGGGAGYVIEDDAGVVVLDGLSAGLPSVPFTFFGVDVSYTLTGPNTYDIQITKYNSEAGTGGLAPDVFDKNTHPGLGGRVFAGTGTIESVALFQQDVEKQSDGFFNNVSYSLSGGGSGADNAANYSGFWLEGDNFGTGFGPWEFASETVGGFAGQFITSGPGAGVDNIGSPSPSGAVWGSFANQGDLSDKSTQFRNILSPISSAGDTFSVSLENGFIDPGGKVGVSLRDGQADSLLTADDFATDALIQFFFEGGDGNYTITDGATEVDTGVAFSFFGVDLDVTLTSSTTYNVDITRYDTANDPAPAVTTLTGLSLATTSGDGTIESFAFFNNDAPNQSDVFFNSLAYQNVTSTENADFDSDGDVDLADLMTFQRGFGVGSSLAEGDANGDGSVDATDLTIWESQFTGVPVSAALAIPEPVSAVLAATLAGLLLARRTSRGMRHEVHSAN